MSKVTTSSNLQLVECIPNVSEGRNPEVIDALVASITAVKDVEVLHVDSNADANRTVITYVGTPSACLQAGCQLIQQANQLIDMRQQQGTHPRFGAVDVFPFVPLLNTKMTDCIRLANELGKQVGDVLEIPVYLYEEAAVFAKRKSLAFVRKGEYEGIASRIAQQEGLPDYGPAQFNECFGSIAIGARKLLAAYNINLSTNSVEKAKWIAARLRETAKDKTFACPRVRAIGWYMESYGCAQVSTNLIDLDVTGPKEAYDACRNIAQQIGVEVQGSELIGLISEQYLLQIGQTIRTEDNVDNLTYLKKAVDYLGLNSVRSFSIRQQVIEQNEAYQGLVANLFN